MVTCDTCMWADERDQAPGQAICRFRPPKPQVDFCGDHEQCERARLTLVKTFPGNLN